MADRTAETRAITLIQRSDNAYLLCRPLSAVETAPWDFPQCPVLPGESVEAAARRLGDTLLGMSLEVDVGMPPIDTRLGERVVVLRYVFCGILGERPGFVPPVSTKWVPKAELNAVSTDPLHRDVVRWLVEHGG